MNRQTQNYFRVNQLQQNNQNHKRTRTHRNDLTQQIYFKSSRGTQYPSIVKNNKKHYSKYNSLILQDLKVLTPIKKKQCLSLKKGESLQLQVKSQNPQNKVLFNKEAETKGMSLFIDNLKKLQKQMIFQNSLIINSSQQKKIEKFPSFKITKKKFKVPKIKNNSQYCPWNIKQQQSIFDNDYF